MDLSFLSWETSEGNSVVLQILNYIEGVLFEPNISWPDDIFEERSFARWAADDILDLVIHNPTIPPDIVISIYLAQVQEYAEQYGAKMFSVAATTAEDILELIH